MQTVMERHLWTNGLLLGEYVDEVDYEDEKKRYDQLCTLWYFYHEFGCTPEEMYSLAVRFQEQHNKLKLVMSE